MKLRFSSSGEVFANATSQPSHCILLTFRSSMFLFCIVEILLRLKISRVGSRKKKTTFDLHDCPIRLRLACFCTTSYIFTYATNRPPCFCFDIFVRHEEISLCNHCTSLAASPPRWNRWILKHAAWYVSTKGELHASVRFLSYLLTRNGARLPQVAPAFSSSLEKRRQHHVHSQPHR